MPVEQEVVLGVVDDGVRCRIRQVVLPGLQLTSSKRRRLSDFGGPEPPTAAWRGDHDCDRRSTVVPVNATTR